MDLVKLIDSGCAACSPENSQICGRFLKCSAISSGAGWICAICARVNFSMLKIYVPFALLSNSLSVVRSDISTWTWEQKVRKQKGTSTMGHKKVAGRTIRGHQGLMMASNLSRWLPPIFLTVNSKYFRPTPNGPLAITKSGANVIKIWCAQFFAGDPGQCQSDHWNSTQVRHSR